MDKYMGNKAKMCDFIYQAVEKEINGYQKKIYDAFTGTTNVAKTFKANGYTAYTNDINEMSYVFGQAYIKCNSFPKFNKIFNTKTNLGKRINKVISSQGFNLAKLELLKNNNNLLTEEYKNLIVDSNYLKILTYLNKYATSKDYKYLKNQKPQMYDFIKRNYTEYGKNSAYINQVYKKAIDNIKEQLLLKKDNDLVKYINKFYKYKDIQILEELKNKCEEKKYKEISSNLSKILKKKNIVGKRMFFSKEHAKRIDIVLNCVCAWKNNDLLSNSEYYILLTSLIETVAIYSNTSATYQAFYKEYKANTQQKFRLIIPILQTNSKTKNKCYLGDVFKNINKPEYDVLYLDPPYNWRQYDSNYHLLNTIAKLNNIEDIRMFEKNIVGASGENRKAKPKYVSFHQKETFEDRLFSLISASKCKLVVLSYSDSDSNHEVNDPYITIEAIKKYFSNNDLFQKKSLKIYQFQRQNFESRKNNKKQVINELLFIAKKSV